MNPAKESGLPRRVDDGFVDAAFGYCVVFAGHGAGEEGSQNGENLSGNLTYYLRARRGLFCLPC